MTTAWAHGLALAVACLATCARAEPAAWEILRAQEIVQCRAGEAQTWPDGADRRAVSRHMKFSYRHQGAPDWFDETTVMRALRKAADAWSQCGVRASVTALQPGARRPGGTIFVTWSEQGSRHNFGLANLGDNSLSLGPSAFQLLQTRNPAYDSRQTLQMVISHEMGHLFGVMAHSKRCVDVTSYYDDGRGATCSIRGGAARPPGVEYRSDLPTACDIERCVAANAVR